MSKKRHFCHTVCIFFLDFLAKPKMSEKQKKFEFLDSRDKIILMCLHSFYGNTVYEGGNCSQKSVFLIQNWSSKIGLPLQK